MAIILGFIPYKQTHMEPWNFWDGRRVPCKRCLAVAQQRLKSFKAATSVNLPRNTSIVNHILFICIYIYTYMFVCVCAYVYTYIYMCMSVRVYVYTYTGKNLCRYVYMIYVYLHGHTRIFALGIFVDLGIPPCSNFATLTALSALCENESNVSLWF